MVINNRVQECIPYAQMNIIFTARMFWRKLAIWTRVYLRSKYFGIGNEEEVFERLYNTPNQYADSLRLIFGNKFSDDYAQLLKQYIIILRELTSAQIGGDIDKINENVNRIYRNARERAKFLSVMNPYWNETEWRNLIDIYNLYAIEEANALARDDQVSSIEIYAQIIAHANIIGDYFSQGLFYFITYPPQTGNQSQSANNRKNRMDDGVCLTYIQMSTIYNIRMFWFELTSWIRAYFINVFGGVGNPANVQIRFDELVNEYRTILTPFFGNEVTEDYIQLVKRYIGLIVALISAQKEGNADAINQITQLLEQSVNERTLFLSAVNPNFDSNTWRTMLTNYNRYLYDETTSFLTGNHSRSLDAYSRLLDLSAELGEKFSYELLLKLGSNV